MWDGTINFHFLTYMWDEEFWLGILALLGGRIQGFQTGEEPAFFCTSRRIALAALCRIQGIWKFREIRDPSWLPSLARFNHSWC